MSRLAIAALAASVLFACTEKSPTPSAAAPAPVPAKVAEAAPAAPEVPSGTQVADFPVTVDAPANAVANDPGGSPGFHAEDGSIFALIGKQPAESPKDLESAKKATEEFAFKKWVKSEKTSDGWVLSWVGTGMDMEGNTYDTFAYEVVKTIGADTWRCYGSVKDASKVEQNLKLCQSLKAG